MLPNTYTDIPYDSRNNPQAGIYRGVGERGKTGTLRGTFTQTGKNKPKGKAPNKM